MFDRGLQVDDLRKAGMEPFAYRFDRTHYTQQLQVRAWGGLQR